MAFALTGLQRLGGGLSEGSVASWNYSSDDDFIAVTNPGYFADAVKIMKLGDSVGVHDTAGVFSEGFVSLNDGTIITVSAKA